VTRRPRRREGVRLRRDQDGSAEVVTVDGTVLGRVNVTAAAAFELCDAATTVDDMAQAASDVFAVDVTDAAADLARAVEALRAMGAIADADADPADAR